MMEDILTSIQREATSAKLKNLREACVLATDGLYLGKTGRENFHPYELREQCLLPLKLALDSRNNKLSVHAVNGLQKLISDDRFRSNCEEDVESQLPVQFFNAVASTPTLSDEVQVEVMKMLLIITSSASCEIHGEYLIKIAEVCIETYTRAHQLGTKTACRATLIQMLSSVCQRLQDSVGTNTSGFDSKIPRPSNLMSTDSSKVLTQDVVLLLKHLSFRLNSGPSSAAQLNHALPLYLESILTMLSNLPPALQLDREFVNVIWQLLCPALIQLLGSPLNDLGRKPKPPGTPDEGNRGGRGTGGLAKSSPVGLTLARTIYHIAGELLRLVGPLAAMRPVLESLFHRIILYPPPLQRNEALKALKEILANPQRLLDASGPTIIDKDNPPSPNSPTEQKKSELDLLRLWMDGIVESSRCNDPAVSSSSVACVVALLGSLEDLSQGRCLDDQDIDMLSKIKEDENWEEVYDGKIKYENAASARMVPKFTVANEAFDDAFREDIGDNEDEDGHRRMKPKHIRWKMDQYSEDGEESIDSVTERFMNDRDIWSADLEDENSDFPQPKSVRWALNDDVLHLEPYDSRQPKTGIPQKPGVPRRNGASQKRFGFVPQNNSVRPVKRTPSMDKSRERPRLTNKMDPDQDRRGSDSNLQNQENGGEKPKLIRSISDLDISPEKQPSLEFPLRRCSSLTELSSPAPEQDGDGSKTKITQPSNKTVPQHDCVNNARPVNKKSIPRLVDRPGTNMQRRGDAIDEEELDDRNRPKRGQIHGAASNDRSPTKPLRPILRRTKSTSEYDRKTGGKGEKPKGILVKGQGGTEEPEEAKPKRSMVKINGVSMSRDRFGKPTPEAKKIEDAKKSVEENEKEGARNFARCLLGILPAVLSMTDPIAVDEAVRQFASDVCEAVTCMVLKRKNVPNFGTLQGRSDLMSDNSSELGSPTLNADGVYLTVYETLAFNLNLYRSGHYQKKTNEPHMTQEEFVESIQNSGIFVGLSSVWLGELYRLVTTYNILSKAGYKADCQNTNRALVSILSDSISQLLTSDPDNSDSTFLHPPDLHNMPPAQREGVRFARKVLVTTWDSVLDVLSIPLENTSQSHNGGNGGNSIAFMLGSSEGKKEQLNRTRDTICLSLDGLRRSARLCCTLGIKTRCETVLAQLANASCNGDTLPLKRTRNLQFSGPIKLHAAQVLSMDALLSVGLELGSHVPKCWKHVFRCCAFISQLEHVHFTGSNVDLSPVSRQMPELSSPMSESSTVSDYLGEGGSDVGSLNEENKQPNNDNVDTSGGILPPEDASRAIYALSAAVDRLYEHASNTLHMGAILEFLKALVYASQTQLFGSSSEDFTSSNTAVTMQPQIASSPTTLHLYRMTDFMLRCIRNGNRPLLHLMRSWIVISEHFAEAACHFDRYVSKLAITSLSDVLIDMLTNRNELPHFWFHETMFKPFENILSLELYGDEEQDQILAILCDIVETHTSNIKSGWRPLFASLRLLRVYPRQYLDALEPELRPPAVFDVISSFLNNKNNSIFAAAAVDCILCLLKYVRGTSLYEESHEDSRSDTDSNASESYLQELCLPALEYLSRVSKRLAAIYIQPSTLVFHGAHSIRLFDMPAQLLSPTTSPTSSPQKSSAHIDPRSATTAESITAIDETGILRVWFLLLEGLTSAVVTCPRKYQPQTLEVLFDILKSITTIPGPHFSVFAITHLLLPMLRSWVRRGNRNRTYWESTAANFKHACGLATELVVEEISQFLNMQGASECVPGLIKQVLDVMTDCVSQPVESVARLGCSCLRHLLLSAGPVFTEDLWQIVCRGLQDAVQSTLSGIKEIVACFQHGSTGVSGDEGMVVKVVARREGTIADTMRLQQIAEQVFLLDSQLAPRKDAKENVLDDEDQRSFVFVVTTIENKDKPEAGKRITFRGLLVGLLSHQLLLQTIGSILLEAEHNSTTAQSVSSVTSEDYEHQDPSEVTLPGLLCYLSPASLSLLFDCLMESHTAAYEFNSRPGLRSLIQKLAKLNYPANLLRQSTSAFTYYLQTLFQICRHSGEHFSSSHIKRILTGERGTVEKDTHIHPHLHVHNHSHHREGDSENRHNDLLKGERNVDWIVRRLNEACNQLSSVYIRLHTTSMAEQYFGGQDVDLDRSWSIASTPLSSPAREPSRTIGSDEVLSSPGHKRRNGSPKKFYEDDPRALDIERQQHMILRRREDDLLQLNTWTSLVIMMLELLMNLPTLQFKAVLPAVFPAVTSLINTGTDTKVSQLVCDVIRRVGSIYGIL